VIGLNPTPPGYYFTGTIDDVRVYNTILSASQIAALTAGLAGTSTYTLGNDTTVGATSPSTAEPWPPAPRRERLFGERRRDRLLGHLPGGLDHQRLRGGAHRDRLRHARAAHQRGTVKIGSTKTLNIDGTLSASSTGAIIQTGGAAATFTTSTSARARPPPPPSWASDAAFDWNNQLHLLLGLRAFHDKVEVTSSETPVVRKNVSSQSSSDCACRRQAHKDAGKDDLVAEVGEAKGIVPRTVPALRRGPRR
jgi:hypothetical protein